MPGSCALSTPGGLARWFLLFVLLASLLACEPAKTEHAALRALPANILWAWERPEDLRWLPSDVGVAYVATSVTLADDHATVMPRTNPLKVRPDTRLVPVVHVDASWRHPPALNAYQRETIVAQVLRVAQTSDAPVVQLDFEVRQSQRAFLLAVVSDIRKQLAPARALSVTALASWCAGDYWLGAMPADEMVPMVFRMARDDVVIRKLLAQQRTLPGQRCQSAAGFATDEAMPELRAGRHYYFSPLPWTAEAWARVDNTVH